MTAPNNNLRSVAAAGVWHNNVALVQLLALCPLLAVTTTAVNGLALGLATTGVLVVTNTVISLLRRALLPSVRIPLFMLLIAALVTCIDLLTHAALDELHEVLGLFIPLLVTNCVVLAQAETVASRRPVLESLLSGLATGIGFLGVLVTLGLLREALGRGTLLADVPMLTGGWGAALRIEFPFDGMLVAILPPGAFFGMALLLALRNRLTRSPQQPPPTPAAESAP